MLAVLADDEAITRETIARFIHETHNLEVIQADSAADAVRLCQARCPSLVLMELLMHGLDTFSAAGEIHRLWPSTKIGILTRHNHPSLLQQARKMRLQGFVLKKDNPSELSYAIRSMLSGGVYIAPSLSTVYRDYVPTDDPLDVLTDREKSVLTLYAQGLSIKQIASELNVSTKTAETHRNNLGRKLGYPNRSQLTAFAIQRHLVGEEQLAMPVLA